MQELLICIGAIGPHRIAAALANSSIFAKVRHAVMSRMPFVKLEFYRYHAYRCAIGTSVID